MTGGRASARDDDDGFLPEIPDDRPVTGVVHTGQVVPLGPRWEHPAQRSFWHSLDAAEREAFEDAAQERSFWAGAVLCGQNDDTTDVLIIKSGWAKVTVETPSRTQIIAVRGPGDVVGERAAVKGGFRSANVVALDDVRALVISASGFRAILADHPHVLEVLNRQERERLTEDVDGFAHERVGVERRLAGLLLELALRRGGYEQDGSVTITLPMSHQELAEWVDARPEAVASFLHSWRKRGSIHSAGRRVTVVDAAGLEKIRGATAMNYRAPSRHLLDVTYSAPLNYSIFLTDVAGFGDPRRDDDDRRVVRDALYRILREAFEGSNVPWTTCLHEDRGDGTLTIVPPTVSTLWLVDPLLALLAAKLKRHNRQAGDPVRIQLRVALHVGPIFRDAQGLCGQSLIRAARMLDAPILKQSLTSTGADLAFIASDHVYDSVVRHAAGLVDPTTFRRVRFQVKESKITSWIHLAG